MQKDERSPEPSQNGMTRRRFMETVVIGFAGTCLCVSCDGSSSSDSNPFNDPTGVYKNLFNTCNAHQGHLAPPDGETPGGEKFHPVMVFFQSLFHYPTNSALMKKEFTDFFNNEYKRMRDASPDILAMIFSCLGDDTDQKTAEQITQDLHNMYPGTVNLIEQADVEASLDPTSGFFLPFGLAAQDPDSEMYYAYPFVFGMGDANYSLIMGILLDMGQEKEWGENFWGKVGDYLYDPTKGTKVQYCWKPSKYRIIPAQLNTGTKETKAFEDYVKQFLHPWDVMETYLDNSAIKYWKPYYCGCMSMLRQKEGDQAVFANWFSDNETNENQFDLSLRRTRPINPETGEPDLTFKDRSDGLTAKIAESEDKYLAHLGYNFKRGGEGEHNYSEFMCNCHLNWCIEHRPRNQYWGQQVIGEAEGVTCQPIQRGLYRVHVIPGACNTCQKCYSTDPPMKEEGGKTVQTFLCPAGAISKVGKEGIAIDKDRCLGCLLCVRNCFRVWKSEANIALWVEPMPEPDPQDLENAIPETHSDMFTVRQKTALDYKWTKFQYEVS
jgi:hypothetical protein